MVLLRKPGRKNIGSSNLVNLNDILPKSTIKPT